MIDAYGADPSRWPDASREDATRLLEQDAAARSLHAEHLALEKVLAASPAMNASQALKDRIVAAAVNDGEVEARVVPIGAGKRAPGQAATPGRAGTYWPAAALAASFACGLYLGIAGLGDVAYQGAVQVSGLSVDAVDGDAGSWLDFNPGIGSEGIL